MFFNLNIGNIEMSKNKRKYKQEPNWRPISDILLITAMIDGEVADNEEQYQTLLQAKDKPHVLDNYTINRAFKVFNEQAKFIELYDEQLLHWKSEKLDDSQKHEIDRLSEQVRKLRTSNRKILDLLNELDKGTIDKILAMDETELALKVLTGEIPFPR